MTAIKVTQTGENNPLFQVQGGARSENKDAAQKDKKTISAAGLNLEDPSLADRKANAKKQAMNVVTHAFGKEQKIDVILSVGGGSVLDCSKAIAAGACYDGDPWDLISYKARAKAALPIVDILTLAATGSEYDCGGVISRTETNDKIGYMDPHLYPVCSILDPTYTFTVSKKQTAAGCADAMWLTQPS